MVAFEAEQKLPSYWRNYLETKALQIKQRVDTAPTSTAVFGFFTDAHVKFKNSAGEQVEGNAGYTGAIMKYLSVKAGVKLWAFGGDALAYENSEELVSESFNTVASWLTGVKHLVVKGNHDLNPYGSPHLTDAQYIEQFYNILVPDNNGKTYYYLDDEKSKTRYIVIDTRETSIYQSYANGSTEEKTYINTEIAWLYETLNSTPDGYQVVALPHAIWWGGGNMSQGKLVLSEAGGDLVNLFGYYNQRKSGTLWGQSYNFTNGKGKVVMVINGHTHIDYSHPYNGVIAASTTADSYQYANARPDSREHKKGTITEQALDIWFIDQTTGKAETVRIGCGNDREFNIGSGQVCKVTNKLTNATTSNNANTAINSYKATITATSGTFTSGEYKLECNGYDITSNYVTVSSDGKTLTIDTGNYLPGDIVITAIGAQVQTFSITKNLTNCTISNNASTIEKGKSYSATITASSGYDLDTITVTMGDVKQNVSDGTINIPIVTGAIVVTAKAVKQVSYTNILRTEAQSKADTSIYNNGLGYKNGYYVSGNNESANAADCITGFIPYKVISTEQPTDVLYIKGYSGGTGESHTRLVICGSDKLSKTAWNGFLNINGLFNVENLGTGYYKLTPKSGIQHSYELDYIRFSFHQADGSGIVITRNEPID